MASFGYETRTAEIEFDAITVEAEGTYNWDETGADVTDITLRDYDTGERVSESFTNSLTEDDWDRIVDAIAESSNW